MMEAVIFDMDGLLVDSEPCWKQAEKETFSEVGLSLSDAMCEETVGFRLDAVVRHWFEKFPWHGQSLQQVQDRIAAQVAELICSQPSPMAGVVEAFAFFRQRNIPIGVCSSSPTSLIAAVVRRFDLEDCIDVSWSAENEALGKPHPAAYLSTASRLGAAPNRCLVFEDSVTGAISAKAAGMKVVAVPEPSAFDSTRFDFCDGKIRSLLDISDELIAKLFPTSRSAALKTHPTFA